MVYDHNHSRQLTQLHWDLSTASAELINEIANERGKDFKSIKTNQIRNVFSEITLIRTKFKQKKEWTKEIESSLILLKPKLAYAKGRNPQVENFQEFMFKAIDSVIEANNDSKLNALENFFLLIESIVAYHKFHGGKES